MYARLSQTIKSTATIGDVMKEIVQILTGAISSTSALQVFDASTSVIISTTATNWVLEYPAVLSSTSNVFILSSQCVTTGKKKYVRLLAKGTGTNQPFIEPLGGSANVYGLVASATTTVGIEMHSLKAFDSGTGAVSNATYFHYSSEGYFPGISGALYLSASARHVLMHTNSDSYATKVTTWALFECPENITTTTKNLVPVLYYRGYGSAETASTTGRDTAGVAIKSIVQTPDGYTISNNTGGQLLSMDTAITSAAISTFGFAGAWNPPATAPVFDKIVSGARNITLRDLFVFDIIRGFSLYNASSLTKVYSNPVFGTMNTGLQNFTIDGVTYDYLRVSYGALLIPKA